MRVELTIGILLIWGSCTAQTQSKPEQGASEDIETTGKVTTAYYRSSDGNDVKDANFRINHGAHDGWLGLYSDQAGYRQTRGGYEYSQTMPWAQLVYSAQVASGGFLGGSISAQTNGKFFAIAGFGRTNLRQYYNLNFDPNDAITIGAGIHLDSKTDLTAYQVQDDRLKTGQRVTHIYFHRSESTVDRFSVDGSYKRGEDAIGNYIYGYAVTAAYAHGPYFIRLSRDTHANFGQADQNKFAVGATFPLK